MKHTLPVINNFRDAYNQKIPYEIKGPHSVLLEINYGCYLKCAPCNKHQWIKDGAKEEDTLDTNELIKLFTDLKALDTKRIMLTGTEPVMRKDIVLILKRINQLCMKPELYVAGIVLNDDVIQTILDYSVDVAFSVDGFFSESHNNIRMPDRTFDAFSTALNSIKKLREAREKRGISRNEVKIMANFTVQRGNIDDLSKVSLNDVDAIGVDFIRMSLVHGRGPFSLRKTDVPVLKSFAKKLQNHSKNTKIRLASDFNYLINDRITLADFANGSHIPSNVINGKLKIRCHRGEYATMIDPIGNVRGCQYLYDDNGHYGVSSRDKYIIGNIRENSIIKIWHSNQYLDYRIGSFPELSAGSRCRNCEYMDIYEEIELKSCRN